MIWPVSRHFAPVIDTSSGLEPARATALEREITDLYAAPPGGPSCHELEYLLVRAIRPER